jgi:L-ascorbate metabolism protein UlaG (beta-lactamase superfamily)
MKITYLYHSGFAVEADNLFLVFDYWRNSPAKGKLKDGVIDPLEISNKKVIVLSSHRHKDHYNTVILGWPKVINDCSIILSDDINARDDAIMVAAHMTYTLDDCTLTTLKSNDEGVAFLLETENYYIYHAGDLNWWHWEGEKGSWNDDIKVSYQKEIDYLKDYLMDKSIDLAFVPLDPRLGEQYSLGLDYFARNLNVRYIVPMHYGKNTKVIDRFLSDETSADYREKILSFTSRGQSEVID